MTPKRYIAGLLILAALAGCNSLGLAPADSWKKRLAYADSQLAGVYEGIGLCVRSMACSKDTGRQLFDQADTSRAALDVAHAAGNGDTVAVCFDKPQPAMACLQSAQAVLAGIEAYLRAKEGPK